MAVAKPVIRLELVLCCWPWDVLTWGLPILFESEDWLTQLANFDIYEASQEGVIENIRFALLYR